MIELLGAEKRFFGKKVPAAAEGQLVKALAYRKGDAQHEAELLLADRPDGSLSGEPVYLRYSTLPVDTSLVFADLQRDEQDHSWTMTVSTRISLSGPVLLLAKLGVLDPGRTPVVAPYSTTSQAVQACFGEAVKSAAKREVLRLTRDRTNGLLTPILCGEAVDATHWARAFEPVGAEWGLALAETRVEWRSATRDDAKREDIARRARDVEARNAEEQRRIAVAEQEALTRDEVACEERLLELEKQRFALRRARSLDERSLLLEVEGLEASINAARADSAEQLARRAARLDADLRAFDRQDQLDQAAHDREIQAILSERKVMAATTDADAAEKRQREQKAIKDAEDLRRTNEVAEAYHHIRLDAVKASAAAIQNMPALLRELLGQIGSDAANPVSAHAAYLNLRVSGQPAPQEILDMANVPDWVGAMHQSFEAASRHAHAPTIRLRKMRLRGEPLTRDISAPMTRFTSQDDLLIRLGDELVIEVECRTAGYLTLLDFGTSGAVAKMTPNRTSRPTDPQVAAGSVVTLPGIPFLDPAQISRMWVTGKEGTERMVAIISPQPIASGVGTCPENQAFAKLNSEDLQELVRRLGTMPASAIGVLDFKVVG